VLRATARDLTPTEIRSAEIQQLIALMRDTMHDAPGVGLAAPQIGVPLALAVIEDSAESPEMERKPVPFHVIVNPRLTLGEEKVDFFEGCLSVDGFRGKVTRPAVVRVQAFDRDGKSIDVEADGLYAVCIQHEMDHLIGKVFLDRMTDLSTLTQLSEFEKFWRKEPTPVI